MRIEDWPFAKLSAREFHDILKLRIDVFVVEQGCPYPELDGRDIEPTTRHVWMADDSGVAACLRVLEDDDASRIGRIVTRHDLRSGGFAGALIRHVFDTTNGPWLVDAQSHLAGWYRERGFAPAGEEFLDFGVPHIPMRRP